MSKKISFTDLIPSLLVLSGGGLLLSGIIRQQRRISFRGASVVITGGSRGLGLEISRLLAREGARLTLLARDRRELERARRELITLGGYVTVHECDIRDPDMAGRIIPRIIAQRGRIDVLINNASLIRVGPFENSSTQDFEEQLDIHVRAPLSLVRAVLPVMKLQGGGRIVNISSVAGVVALPHLISYTASKSALTGLSDGLRAELAREGIFVTTVVPGLMRTGSHVNAFYQGRQKKEFGWFAMLLGVPFLSINAERAARKILDACRVGASSVTLGMPARVLKAMNVFLPGATASIMKLASRALPSPAGRRGIESKTGWESRPRFVPSFFTPAADRAADRNNEQKESTEQNGKIYR